jgi:hypothetical protein
MESKEEPLDVELLRAEVKKTKNELMHVSMELRNLEVESHQAQLRESAKDKTIESLRKEIDELNYYNQRGNASYHSLKEKHTDISLICEEQRLQLQTLSLSLADLSERNSTLKEEVEFERTSHERAVNEFNWYSQKAVEAHQQLRALLLEWDATWPSSLKMRLTEAIESDAKADARLHHPWGPPPPAQWPDGQARGTIAGELGHWLYGGMQGKPRLPEGTNPTPPTNPKASAASAASAATPAAAEAGRELESGRQGSWWPSAPSRSGLHRLNPLSGWSRSKTGE